MKIPEAKAAVFKESEKTRENTRMAPDESKKQERCDRWSKERRQNSAFCFSNGYLPSQEFGAGTKISKIQGSSRAPRWYSERWFRLLLRIYRARVICVTDEDKQQTQHQLTPKSKLKMHRHCWKSQSQNVQIFGFVLQNTNGRNHGLAWKTQSFLLSEICTVILWQDYYGKGNSRKFYLNTVGKKFQIGNAYL